MNCDKCKDGILQNRGRTQPDGRYRIVCNNCEYTIYDAQIREGGICGFL